MIKLLLNRVVLIAISMLFVFCLSVGIAESGTIEVYASVGITDAEGVLLRGDGGPDSDLVQVIYAGPDRLPNPPGVGGVATGDDVLLRLETGVVGQRYTRIGSGFPFDPDEGKFHGDFRHNLPAEAKIYVRAWNAPIIDEATHYGDSALYKIRGLVGESHDFVAWSTTTEPPPGVGLDITPPYNVTNFKAVAGDRMITLTWTNPTGPANADFKETFIVRRTGSYPTSIGDGTIVRSDQADPGTTRTWTNVGLSSGTTYFYTAFARDTSDNFASGVQASATTTPAPVAPVAPDAACFIATAAYGTPLAEEVEVLKRFRDEHLFTNPAGEAFVRVYYKVSPPLARFIRNRPLLKAVVRGALRPLIWMSEKVIE